MLRPQRMADKFGIAATGAALPYVVSTGVRDVFIAVTVLTLFYFQSWAALGYISFGIGIVAVSVFVVGLKHGNKTSAIAHAVGAMVVIAYGFYLICN